MSEFSAFLAGLFLGDTSPGKSSKKKQAPLKTNIALQDVAFCQCLRAAIDGLDRYVQSNHPSPEEFIRYLLPDTSGFTEPYTENERKTIEENEAKVKGYVAWIEAKIESKRRLNDPPDALTSYHLGWLEHESPLMGGDTWEDLDAIHMVWQDEAHTPDPDNLDLLFGNYYHSEPIKKDGRIYEYKNPDQVLLGLASGFFESIPAKLILRRCLTAAQGTVTSKGYAYDHTRFEEYDIFGKKEQQARAREYMKLLEKSPGIYLPVSPWSPVTVKVREAYEYNQEEHAPLSRKERKRRRAEAKQIGLSLTKEEREEFDVLEFIKGKWDSFPDWFIGFYLLTFVVLAIVCLATKSLPVVIIASVMGVVIMAALLLFIALPRKNYISPSILDYITLLQEHYYDKKDDAHAKRYEELLKRLNK